MYNRYINASDFQDFFDSYNAENPTGSASEDQVGGESAFQEPQKEEDNFLKRLFGGKLKLPEFNSDTLLLVALAYFLVADADSKEKRNETLLILGALLLLGF